VESTNPHSHPTNRLQDGKNLRNLVPKEKSHLRNMIIKEKWLDVCVLFLILCCVVLYCILYDNKREMVRCLCFISNIVLCCIVLYYIILYCIVLYCMV
jgi:hypothetical protein